MLEWQEILFRLGTATVAGGAIGLNRELHDKPVGVRTLGLVGLAASLVVVVVARDGAEAHVSDAASRVIQGLLTGIGFLGAGVIVRGRHHGNVHGLTSAACVWFTACVGVVCGLGKWEPVMIALLIALLLLVAGGPMERMFHRKFLPVRAHSNSPNVSLDGAPDDAPDQKAR